MGPLDFLDAEPATDCLRDEHKYKKRLACHQCGYELPMPTQCPQCNETGTLIPCGPGVERVAEEFAQFFPDARYAIASSDTLHGPAPLRLASRFRGEIYCGFAEHDRHMTLPQIEEMAALMQPHPVKYGYAVHAGAIHGYSLPQRDVYDKAAAERDWERIFAMFHRQIPPRFA